jgi:hypothetical protein
VTSSSTDGNSLAGAGNNSVVTSTGLNGGTGIAFGTNGTATATGNGGTAIALSFGGNASATAAPGQVALSVSSLFGTLNYVW